MADGTKDQVGSVPVTGGEVRFTYDAQGNVIATFEDVVYRDDGHEQLLAEDWRDSIARATGGEHGDSDARHIAFDDIIASARVADVHREAGEALEKAGKGACPEVAYLRESFKARLMAIRAKYGDILRVPDANAEPPRIAAVKRPAGFEDTPFRYAPDGTPIGFDYSKGFKAPGGFTARFEYNPDGSIKGLDADVRVDFITATRELLRPGWEGAVKEQVKRLTKRSIIGAIRALLSGKPKDSPEEVRKKVTEDMASLLYSVMIYSQALLGLERAGMGKTPEAGFLRQIVNDTKEETVMLLGGTDVFRQ